MGRIKYLGPKTPTRFPEPFGELQVNFCKNPRCANYAKPATIAYKKRGRRPKEAPQDTDEYVTHWARQDVLCMRCLLCKEKPPVKSNRGVQEERERMLAYLQPEPEPEPSCPNEGCPNHQIPVSTGTSHYYRNGTTKVGTPRYVCRSCKKSFTVPDHPKPTLRQRKSYVNRRVFRGLFTGAHIYRIYQDKEIAPTTFYKKLDFIHRQCVAFAASRERRFLEGTPLRVKNDETGQMEEIERLYISVDRQVYAVNWSNYERRGKDDPRKHRRRLSRRVTLLNAITSCDEERRYIFGLHLNFDSSMEYGELRAHLDATGEEELPQCFRRYARFWTEREHREAAERNAALKRKRELLKKRKGGQDLTIEEDSELRYVETMSLKNLEAADSTRQPDTRLPLKGLQIHDDYVIYGHFFFLRDLLGWVKKIRFFFEQESSMRAACLTAFADMVQEQRCDAFFVWFKKNLSNVSRTRIFEDGRARIADERAALECTEKEARLSLLKRAIREAKPRKRGFNDRFMKHPFPGKAEPGKEVAYLTDRGTFSPDGIVDEDHLANLYNKATMHNLDAFFNQVRSSIGPLSRRASNVKQAPKGGKWEKHHPYRPGTIVKWLEIFRVYHNFVLTGEDGKTPAMRMGLARAPIAPEKILRFQPA